MVYGSCDFIHQVISCITCKFRPDQMRLELLANTDKQSIAPTRWAVNMFFLVLYSPQSSYIFFRLISKLNQFRSILCGLKRYHSNYTNSLSVVTRKSIARMASKRAIVQRRAASAQGHETQAQISAAHTEENSLATASAEERAT